VLARDFQRWQANPCALRPAPVEVKVSCGRLWVLVVQAGVLLGVIISMRSGVGLGTTFVGA
jgi:hypothetical protein